MLCLTRKERESVVIVVAGVPITILVRSLRGNRVSLGIEAPPEATIVRGELLKKDQDQDRRRA